MTEFGLNCLLQNLFALSNSSLEPKPWSTISTSLLTVSGILSVVLAACCLPDAKFAERLARAMIPFVSFHRPTNIQNEFLEPIPIAFPKVLAFHSTVEPPLYTLCPAVSASEARGDLRILKGSRVQLDIDVNQKLSKARIEFQFEIGHPVRRLASKGH